MRYPFYRFIVLPVIFGIWLVGNTGIALGDYVQVAGTWSGILEGDETRKDMQVTFRTGKKEKGSVDRFHFGPPRSCSIFLEFIGQTGNEFMFVVSGATGGYCDKVWHEHLIIELTGDTSMVVKVPTDRSGISEKAELVKEP